MADLREAVRNLWSQDAATRSNAIRAIADAPASGYDSSVISALAESLDHDDYEIQEWASKALSRCKGDPHVVEALRNLFRTGARHSARSCALIALGHLGEHLPEQEVLALYRERQDHPKDLI